MDEKVFLAVAFSMTETKPGHGGRGVRTTSDAWAAPEKQAAIAAALRNGYLVPLPGQPDCLVISDLGRQRLRALGGFKGTEWEHVRYTVTPDGER